jgi:hypothetical protein
MHDSPPPAGCAACVPCALREAGVRSEKERVAAGKDRHPKAFNFKETRQESVRAGSAMHDGILSPANVRTLK